MKLRLLFLVILVSSLAENVAYSQKLKLVAGSLTEVKKEKTIVTKLSFDDMAVGKYDHEADYVAERVKTGNEKEAGKGDKWAASWVNDREKLFHPKFDQLLEETTGMKVSPKGKYTLIYRTTFTEPGFNVGVMSKNASINGEATIVETANPSNVIAKITVINVPGRTGSGYDFDTGGRISEAYELSGKALGKFIMKAK